MLPLLAETIKAGSVEALHFGITGLYQAGSFKSNNSLDYPICLRSVAKPFQTLACLRLGLKIDSPRELALCTSSHSGAPAQVDLVNKMCGKWQLKPLTDLQCGEHKPLGKNIEPAAAGTITKRLQNNCSAKHAMLLATCKLKDWDLQSYLQVEHPLQKAIQDTILQICQLAGSQLQIGLDGCGLPTYTMPLQNLLLGFNYIHPDNQNDLQASQIGQTMQELPVLVSGENRLDYELAMGFKQQISCKSGTGGLTLVNLPHHATLALKMFDPAEKVRALLLRDLIRQVSDLPFESEHQLFDPTIFNLHKQAAASIELKDLNTLR